jgi:hypothetical protein
MKNWNLLFRRTHLYLGLLLIPWMLVYALSTFVFNHGEHFRAYRAAEPLWLPLWEKDYAFDAPADAAGLRAATQRLLDEHGLSGAFAARRQGQRLNINVQNFWHPRRVTYDFTTKKLRAEERRSTPLDVLIRLHERAGYGQGGPLNNLWAFFVDLFSVATLAWIATGLFLWWKLSATRRWGWLALGGGLATILALLATL